MAHVERMQSPTKTRSVLVLTPVFVQVNIYSHTSSATPRVTWSRWDMQIHLYGNSNGPVDILSRCVGPQWRQHDNPTRPLHPQQSAHGAHIPWTLAVPGAQRHWDALWLPGSDIVFEGHLDTCACVP
eukprot:2804321-Rhodomonas_salina.4